MSDWAWLIKTPGVDLGITVVGRWTQAEAAKLVWKAFEEAALPPIIGMIPRKRLSGDAGDHGTIYEQDGKIGFSAGRQFFVAAGRVAEYEAQVLLLEEPWH